MQDHAELLARMAAAMERMAPPAPPATEWLAHPAYIWNGSWARDVDAIDAPALDLLRGIERQKEAVVGNVTRLANGAAAHDMLLWGARGMGKSALLRAAIMEQQAAGAPVALVQVASDAVSSLPALFTELAGAERNFLVFLDDLGFAEGDSVTPHHLRSWLDGGVQARPTNVRIAVTSNRRAIVVREAGEQADPLHPRDAIDDALALVDRFGLVLGFHAASQDDYLAMLRGYARAYGLQLDEAEALAWARQRGALSGRTAWHYIIEIAGRAGRRL
ncbi:DUF815 domain-containing protein [Erythrobacter arachoides]|uniref:DUF815 domain-containing protein n=1 Tax=Aurantiacibacter arachoides TaxID=1850444 RepID=A0A845A680_9SPHN|nr:DUF815 domain-containing protein [Aurantiacibacter arachoides]MXO94656.1 DUF815 domain-containing protein [Aurantiacibacter arachoides]GGD61786.1 ATPase AAA [Aurantiacibacter arachoides]